ncbi:MAG: enoyl-CoA hydratase/isomerase family protein [Roseovarius sp.]
MSDNVSLVLCEDQGPVRILTMNLPEKRNALSTELRDALVAAVQAAYDDTAVRALVLTGTGKNFCAGGDLDGLPVKDPLATRARLGVSYSLVRMLASGPKPVIAAVNGNAFGAGLSLAMACDYVLGTARTRFCTAFSKVGLMADLGLIWTLSRRMGQGELRRHLMCAPVIEGEEAGKTGMIDRFVEDESALCDEAITMAEEFAAAPPVAVALTKSLLVRGGSLDDVLAAELTGQCLLFSSADYEEGKRAFFERRSPDFKGS